jgi:hypothetical protein
LRSLILCIENGFLQHPSAGNAHSIRPRPNNMAYRYQGTLRNLEIRIVSKGFIRFMSADMKSILNALAHSEEISSIKTLVLSNIDHTHLLMMLKHCASTLEHLSVQRQGLNTMDSVVSDDDNKLDLAFHVLRHIEVWDDFHRWETPRMTRAIAVTSVILPHCTLLHHLEVHLHVNVHNDDWGFTLKPEPWSEIDRILAHCHHVCLQLNIAFRHWHGENRHDIHSRLEQEIHNSEIFPICRSKGIVSFGHTQEFL